MTQDELDALPECGGIGIREEVIDGRTIKIPFVRESFALYHAPDDPVIVVDRNGTAWSVGWANGVKYKRIHPPLT